MVLLEWQLTVGMFDARYRYHRPADERSAFDDELTLEAPADLAPLPDIFDGVDRDGEPTL